MFAWRNIQKIVIVMIMSVCYIITKIVLLYNNLLIIFFRFFRKINMLQLSYLLIVIYTSYNCSYLKVYLLINIFYVTFLIESVICNILTVFAKIRRNCVVSCQHMRVSTLESWNAICNITF